MSNLRDYRDQIQERIDRLEVMEPAFEALRKALQNAARDIPCHRILTGVMADKVKP